MAVLDRINWPDEAAANRVSLRRFESVAPEAAWLEEAAQAIAGRRAPCRLRDRLSDGDRGWGITADGEQVGALAGRIVELSDNGHLRALIWTWLAIDQRWRAYGYGGLSVPLFESVARQLGATTALVPLPADNGVALYFWLRLGYTPQRSVQISPPDRPAGVPADALWMHRTLIEPPTETD